MFKDAKVGDKVWGLTLGWGTILEIRPEMKHSAIVVRWDLDDADSCFGFDGKANEKSLKPFIYWDEIQITPPLKPKVKVKRTVEGWANLKAIKKEIEGDGLKGGVFFLRYQVDKDFIPATLTYEDEE